MARSINNPFLAGLTGKIGSVLFKQTRNGTIVALCPSEQPKGRKRNERQIKAQRTFAAAVKYAKDILLKRKMQGNHERLLPKGQTVYNAAIKEFMSKHSCGQQIAQLDPSQYFSMSMQEQKEDLPVLFDF